MSKSDQTTTRPLDRLVYCEGNSCSRYNPIPRPHIRNPRASEKQTKGYARKLGIYQRNISPDTTPQLQTQAETNESVGRNVITYRIARGCKRKWRAFSLSCKTLGGKKGRGEIKKLSNQMKSCKDDQATKDKPQLHWWPVIFSSARGFGQVVGRRGCYKKQPTQNAN